VRSALFALAMALALLVSHGAQAATLSLVLAGESFDGFPVVEVRCAGQNLDRAVLTEAVDIRTGQRLRDVDPQSVAQSFEISIPEGSLETSASIELHFINDDWGGPGTNLIRSVFILSAALDGRPVALADIGLRNELGPVTPVRLWRGMVPLRDGGIFAVLPARR
jgi:hypothetical protein